MPTPIASPEILAFAAGFPLALLHAAATLLILAAGAALYALLTPHREIALIREGNTAAAISFGGVLAGLALPVHMATGGKKDGATFAEDLLFTHRGLSGPAVLQVSSYWREGQPLRLNLVPETDLATALGEAKQRSRKRLANELATWMPSRLAEAWAAQSPEGQRPMMECSDKALARLAERLARWELIPTGTEGYKKAEVTLGGVDTRDLSQQTMESKQPGLYFIGEVVDVTGWLGGYNFQWAWASGYACGMALGERV